MTLGDKAVFFVTVFGWAFVFGLSVGQNTAQQSSCAQHTEQRK